MKKYAKIEDEKTGVCSVGVGTDTEYYKSIGMTELDVAQAWNGLWYLSDKVPEKPADVVKKERIDELEKYLSETDWYVLRKTETNKEYDEKIKTQRQAARDEISKLRGE